MNIGLISGGQALNALAENASASIMFRLVTSPDDILKRVARVANGRVNIGAKIGRNDPVGLSTPPAPYPSHVVAFNTDIPYFSHSSQAKGVYLFGAGSITDAHSEWEFVKETDLLSAVQVHVDMAVRLLL
jgi:acetylornithine deacetylase/succinyl-diaminopimelate desuccinylase-like protein